MKSWCWFVKRMSWDCSRIGTSTHPGKSYSDPDFPFSTGLGDYPVRVLFFDDRAHGRISNRIR